MIICTTNILYLKLHWNGTYAGGADIPSCGNLSGEGGFGSNNPVLKVASGEHEGVEDESIEFNRPFGIILSLESYLKGASQVISSCEPCNGSSMEVPDLEPLNSLEAYSSSEEAIGISNAD